jgi:hypothetical protein
MKEGLANGDPMNGHVMSLCPRALLIAAFLAALSLAAAPAPASDRAEGLARLAGVWQLDHRVSDDPIRMLRSAGVPPPGERPGGRRSPEARREDERAEGVGLLEERLEAFTEGIGVLTIAFEDPELSITYWDDRERVLVVNGKERDAEGPRGPVRVEADWGSSDRLVVKTHGDPAGKVVEVFEIGGRGEKLFVTVDLYRKGTKRRFSFQRLYYRLESGH